MLVDVNYTGRIKKMTELDKIDNLIPALIWHTEIKKLAKLKNWKKNPRKISKENLEKLKERINKRGFHAVLTLDNQNTVLSGNQRLKALRELGWIEVECKIPNRELTDDEKDKVGLESNINDGEIDFTILSENFDFEFLQDVGLSAHDLDVFTTYENDVDIDLVETFSENVNFLVKCKNLSEHDELKRLLKTQSNEISFSNLLLKIKFV